MAVELPNLAEPCRTSGVAGGATKGDNVNKQVASRWRPGQSGNPAGRPVGSRSKLVESFVSDLQEKWRTDGATILDRLALNEPAKLVEAISRLAPKDVAVTLEQRNSLGVDPRLWAGFQRVLAAIEECAPEGMQPVEVFESLEHLVRSHFAKPIESQADTSSARLVENSK